MSIRIIDFLAVASDGRASILRPDRSGRVVDSRYQSRRHDQRIGRRPEFASGRRPLQHIRAGEIRVYIVLHDRRLEKKSAHVNAGAWVEFRASRYRVAL
jgi:hypothetical protein